MTRLLLPLLLLLVLPGTAGADPGFMEWPTLQGAGKKRPVFSYVAGAASAPATLTASTGQTITCTRAASSNATYQTGATAIAYAAANTCRVDYRGLLVEESRTNYLLQSGNLASASWNHTGGSIATANQGVFVDGATTMAKIDNTSGSNTDTTFQGPTEASSTRFALSAWFQAVSGTATVNIGMSVPNTAACSCGPGLSCTTFSHSTGECEVYLSVGTTNTRVVELGTNSVATTTALGWWNGGARYISTGVAYISGAQNEVGSFATSYIPTTTTATARAADVVDVGAVTLPLTYSLSATVNLEGLPASGTAIALDATDGTHIRKLSVDTSGHAVCAYGATTDSTTSTLAAGTATKIACKYDGTKVYACLSGACTAGTAAASDGAMAMAHIYVGSDSSANFLNGFASTLCAGKSGACPP